MSKTELKVKVASLATYAAGLAASAFLATTATDFVHALPDQVEVIVYPAFLAAVTWVAGYVKRSMPDSLSPSTREAARVWLEARMPKR